MVENGVNRVIAPGTREKRRNETARDIEAEVAASARALGRPRLHATDGLPIASCDAASVYRCVSHDYLAMTLCKRWQTLFFLVCSGPPSPQVTTLGLCLGPPSWCAIRALHPVRPSAEESSSPHIHPSQTPKTKRRENEKLEQQSKPPLANGQSPTLGPRCGQPLALAFVHASSASRSRRSSWIGGGRAPPARSCQLPL
jgi:hypothetical protein